MNAEDLLATKSLPVEEYKFMEGDIVISPIGRMIVVDTRCGCELKNKVWIPNIQLAFLTNKGKINKTRNHRFFTQDRLSKV